MPIDKTHREIAVLGGGSFGTTLCNMVAEKGHHATLWLRNEAAADEINTQHVNSRYLPEFTLNERVRATTDLSDCVSNADIVFVSVPSKSCREVAKQLQPYLKPGTFIVSTTKGIEHHDFKLMSEVLHEELPDFPIGVLSGPNLAKEIIAQAITGTVIASQDEQLIKIVQDSLQSHYFRVYGSKDLYGVELGGALKNIYAIISGMGVAMEMGDNTRAMLMTRSLAEMSRFAVKLGGEPITFLGLAGVGDLIVTCSSSLSRNYQVGYAVGSGKSLDEAVAELGQVAEGVNTLKLVKVKADEMGVYMPLVTGLYEVLFNNLSIVRAVNQLMLSEQGFDVDYVLKETF